MHRTPASRPRTRSPAGTGPGTDSGTGPATGPGIGVSTGRATPPPSEPGDAPAPEAPRRRRSKQETCANILAAAERLFGERGPDLVSVGDVAIAAGVTHPLVLRYFGTYSGLVLAVFEKRALAARALVRECVNANPSVRAKDLLRVFTEFLGDPVNARLVAWTAADPRRSGNYRTESMRLIADALFMREEQGARAASDLDETPARALQRTQVDRMVLIAVSATYGYALCRPWLVGGLGWPLTAESDNAFLDALSELTDAYVEHVRAGKSAR